MKNQVIKFVNNAKFILVAQNFHNAVADTVDTFYVEMPTFAFSKKFRGFS
jgi:hypothetical protein